MKDEPIVLALYPNSGGLCYVLASSAQNLMDYGIARIHPMTVEAHLKRTRKLMADYAPDLIVLRDALYGRRISSRVKDIIKILVKEAQLQEITCHLYSRKQIKEVFSHFGAKNKEQIAEAIVDFLPELKSELPKIYRKYPEPERWNMGLFDGVSLILTFYYFNQ